MKITNKSLFGVIIGTLSKIITPSFVIILPLRSFGVTAAITEKCVNKLFGYMKIIIKINDLLPRLILASFESLLTIARSYRPLLTSSRTSKSSETRDCEVI